MNICGQKISHIHLVCLIFGRNERENKNQIYYILASVGYAKNFAPEK